MNVSSRRVSRLTGVIWLVLACTTGAYADSIADKVTVSDPYVRAIPPVVKTTAAFMQLQSSDSVERFLVGASSPAAGIVELHMHTMDNGVMRMRQIPHIHLPPGQVVSLQPGGLHVMLFDVKAPLNPGDQIPITLTFEDGSTKQISAVVRPVDGMMRH
ncbi:MAG: copper chaperone PCu(A)C [Chromatiaceae bacterium]|jgi:copper(I)-binding protein|nr:copper chaperone PCu(A)C [Chromatiaceae bacterium]